MAGLGHSISTLIALLVLGASFAFDLRTIAQRPQVNADDRVAVTDDQMRRRSAAIVQGLLLLTLGATLVDFSIFGSAQPPMPRAERPTGLA